jgi:hypothetical protein
VRIVKRARLAAGVLVLALVLAALLCGAAPATAHCGQDYHATPASSDVPGGAPLAIGDSVLADAVAQLVGLGFEADGMVCRQMSQGVALLRARGRSLPHLVVLALGANGEVTPQQIDTVLSILGPERILALVVPHGSVVASTATVVRAAAAGHAGRIILLDWDRLVEGHPDWLAPDGVHLGGSAGIEAFARMVATVRPYATTAPPSGGDGTPTTAGASRELETPTEPGTPITIQPPPGHRSSSNPAPGRASGRLDVATGQATLARLAVLAHKVAAAAATAW